jgi:hypothetical protein
MGYRSTVRSNVNKAFQLIGDLAQQMTLYKSKPVAYDFSEGEVEIKNEATLVVTGVLINASQSRLGNGALTQGRVTNSSIIIKKEDVEDYSILTDFDRIKVGTKKYGVVGFEDNDYTITLTVVKGE